MKVITVTQDIINAFDKLPSEAVMYMIYLQRNDLYNYSPTVQAGFLTMFRKHKYIEYPIYNLENHSISCGEHIMYFPRLNWTGISDDLKRKILFFNFTGSAIECSETLGLTKPKYDNLPNNGMRTHIPESIHHNGGSFLYPIMGNACVHNLYDQGIWQTPEYKRMVFTLEKMFSVGFRKKILKGEHFAAQPIRKKTTVLEYIKNNVDIQHYTPELFQEHLKDIGLFDFEVHEDDMELLQRSLHFEDIQFKYTHVDTLTARLHVEGVERCYMLYPIRFKTNSKKERRKRLRDQHFNPNKSLWERSQNDSRKKRKLYHSNYEFEPVRDKYCFKKDSIVSPIYWPLPNTSVQERGKFRNYVYTGKVKYNRVWRYEIQEQYTLEKQFITEGKVHTNRRNWNQISLFTVGDRTLRTKKRKRLEECGDLFEQIYKRVKKAANSEPKNGIQLGGVYGNDYHL